MRSLAAMLLAFASAASAQGLDRDTLLTDAPAVPPVGTVRLAGAGVATEKSDSSSSSLTGSVGWTPIQNLHGDVGAYFQSGAQGPAARVRYQLLNQFAHGLDLAGGMRFKTVGFHPDQGEVEFLLRVGEYQAGNDPLADQAIERMPAIRELLTQRSDEPADFAATIAALQQVAS